MSSTPQFISTVRTAAASIANGDGTAFKSFFVAGASGSRVDAASITNSDAANAYVVQVAVKIGGTDYVVGEVTVPVGAGTNGSAKAVNLLDSTYLPQLAATLGVLYLGAGAELRLRAKSVVAGSNSLTFVAHGGDY
jgi:hypothetical protein